MASFKQWANILAVFGLVVIPMIGASKPDFLGKSYTLSKSEKFDEFMSELGVGWIARKAGCAVSPTVTVTEDNGIYTMKTESTFKDQILNFKLGEEFDEKGLDGSNYKSVITLDGNKMLHLQKRDGKTVTIEREFGPTEMKAILKVGDIVSTRIYNVQ